MRWEFARRNAKHFIIRVINNLCGALPPESLSFVAVCESASLMPSSVDYVLLFNAGIFLLFGLPHILSDDGNIGAMGWDIAKFMPMKGRTPLPVPTEINLLITHICAILGSAQVSLITMCLVSAYLPAPIYPPPVAPARALVDCLCVLTRTHPPTRPHAITPPSRVILLALPFAQIGSWRSLRVRPPRRRSPCAPWSSRRLS